MFDLILTFMCVFSVKAVGDPTGNDEVLSATFNEENLSPVMRSGYEVCEDVF